MLTNPGLYIHFPWCVKKCPYCDFNSHPLKPETDFQDYVQALLVDFKQQSFAGPFQTVFLGGGTPSLLAPTDIAALLKELPLAAGAEVTMEANPGTTEHANFADYLSAGVNRLSIGAQSFQNEQLLKLGRIHQADEIIATFTEARNAGFNNINLDLMWALPGQSLEQCILDLQTAIDLGPEHISWYQLTLEPKTEFARRPPVLPLEDAVVQMEQQGNALLASHAYDRYEVSAFAHGDHRCKHNVNYWKFGDYVGIGAGAHGKVTRSARVERTQKAHQPRLFLNDPTHTERRTVSNDDLVFEFMLNALRLVGGVSFEEFEQRTSLDRSVLEGAWHKLVAMDLVHPHRVATTPLGYRYLDTVVAEFLPQT